MHAEVAELVVCHHWTPRSPQLPCLNEATAVDFDRQLELVDPDVIVLAGATAVEAILGIKGGMSQLRGRWQHWNQRAVMPVFHPSYLLRNPSDAPGAPLDLARGDLSAVRRRLCER